MKRFCSFSRDGRDWLREALAREDQRPGAGSREERGKEKSGCLCKCEIYASVCGCVCVFLCQSDSKRPITVESGRMSPARP